MKLFWIYVILGLVLSCGNKKQTLRAEEKKDETIALNTAYESEVVLDNVIPNPGIKYKPKYTTDPKLPPVTINLAKKPDDGELDLADYYSTVKYVKLKHPLAEQGKGFLGEARVRVFYPPSSSASQNGFNSDVYLTSENVIAGDRYFGYHCYDLEGNYIYTLVSIDKLPDYDKRKNEVSFESDKSAKSIWSFSVYNNNCLIYSGYNDKPRLQFHNIQSKKTYLSKPFYGSRPTLIGLESLISYYYSAYADKQQPIMHSFNLKGDTLCRFMSRNPLPETELRKKSGTNPDGGDFYYHNDILTIRQAYNDTIYRIISPNNLVTAYTLDFGKQKATIGEALFGDKTKKLLPYTWVEADKFVFIIHTENYDCPSNRDTGSITFFYSYYDKEAKKLFRITDKGFPESFIMKNSMENAIPVLAENMNVYKEKLYVGNTKSQMGAILKHKDFPSLDKSQQDKVQSLHDEMSDDEFLVMILK